MHRPGRVLTCHTYHIPYLPSRPSRAHCPIGTLHVVCLANGSITVATNQYTTAHVQLRLSGNGKFQQQSCLFQSPISKTASTLRPHVAPLPWNFISWNSTACYARYDLILDPPDGHGCLTGPDLPPHTLFIICRGSSSGLQATASGMCATSLWRSAVGLTVAFRKQECVWKDEHPCSSSKSNVFAIRCTAGRVKTSSAQRMPQI